MEYTAWQNPASWLFRWFARAYYMGDKPKKVVGFCVHLGGYTEEIKQKLDKDSLAFPFMNVSVLISDRDLSGIARTRIYDALYGGGWWPGVTLKVEGGKLAVGSDSLDNQTVRETTYFVDLLSLTDGDLVNRLVVEPMIKMYAGQEDWVIKQGIPALH